MKIWHVVHGFAPEMTGGTERTVEALARAMSQGGHEVAVVCGSIEPASSARVDELDVGGLRVLRLHREDLFYESWYKTWSPLVGAAFDELLARERPDVVHVHHWIRLSSDLVRRARATAAVVAVTMHDFFATFASPIRRFGDDTPQPPAVDAHLSAAECAAAFADHRDDFIDEIAAAHLRYAPCASHAAELAATASGEFGPIRTSAPPLLHVPARLPVPSSRGRRLVTWGALYPEKGLDLVLDALFSVGGDWTLDVYGEAHDEAYRERLAARVKDMPVVLHGAFSVDDLASIEADYAVLPSMCHESYGLTLDEAQCLGLPVLAAALPSYVEHAAPDSTAFFAPCDAGDLAMLLLDDARLAALTRPAMPALRSPESAARALLDDYSAARRGEFAALGAPPLMTPERRAAAMYRRAEWREWSLRQHAERRSPPDAYLA